MSGTNGPVLDRDRLDAAADRLLGGVRIDVAAVLAESETRTRRARRRRLATTVGVLAAAAAVILAVFAGLTPGVLAQPQPAEVPEGPGAVPTSVHVPPPWTPSATESPISRAAYVVLDARPFDTRLSGSRHAVWLVGADGGQYRYLPAEKPQRVAVSRDGAYVTWIELAKDDGGLAPQADVLRILKVSTGAVTSVPFPGVAGRGFAVEGTAFAPAGHELAVWGRNRGVDGGTRTSPEAFVVPVDQAKPAVVTACRCAAPGSSMGFGVRPDGTAIPVASLPLGGLPPAPVADGDGVPPGLPPGPITQPPLLAPDGRTLYAIAGKQLTPRSAKGIETYRYSLLTPGDGPVELGDGTAVMGLGVGSRGAVISLWTSTNGNERVGTGPGTVVVVDPVRLTATRVTRTEDTARVIAAATAVLDGGRTAPAAEQGRWTDVHWWTWHGGRLVGWVGGVPLWALALAALVGLAVAARLAPLPRPGVRVVRIAAAGVAVLAVVAVAGAGVVMVAGELLGSPTAGSEPSAAGATPVIPWVLADQHRRPPRPFDTPGAPGTRRVSAVFDATIAGVEGQYALDAATGRTVRLDDLPGLPTSPNDVTNPWPTRWTVSPDGRYLASASDLVDLETARARPATAFEQSGRAVLNDGTIVTTTHGGDVWVQSPGGAARRVARFPGAFVHGLEPGSGAHALMLVSSKTPAAAVLDVRTGKLAVTPLPPDDERAPLAVSPRGELVSASGEPAAAVLRAGRPLSGPERRLVVSDGGRPVYLAPGPDQPGTPLEIRRQASPGVRTVTRLDFAPGWMQLAADVVADAQPVDVREPGWAVVTDTGARALAGRVLAVGVLVLLLMGMAAAAVRRPRPYRRGDDEPPGAPTPPTGPTASPGPP